MNQPSNVAGSATGGLNFVFFLSLLPYFVVVFFFFSFWCRKKEFESNCQCCSYGGGATGGLHFVCFWQNFLTFGSNWYFTFTFLFCFLFSFWYGKIPNVDGGATGSLSFVCFFYFGTQLIFNCCFLLSFFGLPLHGYIALVGHSVLVGHKVVPGSVALSRKKPGWMQGGMNADIQQGALIYTGAPLSRVTGRRGSSKQNRGSGIDSFRRKILLVIQSSSLPPLLAEPLKYWHFLLEKATKDWYMKAYFACLNPD